MLVSNGLHPPFDHACHDLQLYNAGPKPHLDNLELGNVRHDGRYLIAIVTHEGLGHR